MLAAELIANRLEAHGKRGSKGLLALLVEQLQLWGAAERVNSSSCQQGNATEVAVVNDALRHLRDGCSDSFRARGLATPGIADLKSGGDAGESDDRR